MRPGEERAASEVAGGGGPITRYLAEDHARLDGLLARALAAPGGVDLDLFGAFRAGLLRHIAIEEKLLFPALREARGGAPHPHWVRLRIDHGALTSLLVPPPTPALVAELRSILVPHNALEEGAAAPYAAADLLLPADAAALLERMRAYPPVRVAPYRDGPRVLRTAADALRQSALQFQGAPRSEPGEGG
jgi:hypothetical protein